MNASRVQPDSYCFKALLWFILLFLLPAAPVSAVGGDDSTTGSSLVLTLGKERVYPGEHVPVTVTMTMQGESVRNISFPEFASSQLEVSEIHQLDQQDGDQSAGMTRYRFGGRLKTVRPGSFTIGPATLSCEVMENAKGSSAFFGGQEPRLVRLESAPANLEVFPLPSKGKPALFSGAVGNFSLSVKTVPSQVAIGEPITVTTMIRGTGSLEDAACPALVDSAMQSFPVHALRSTAELTCEQVVMPQRATSFPPIIWSYFDPDNKTYRVLKGNVDSRVMALPTIINTQPAQITHSAAERKKPFSYLPYFLSIMTLFLLITLSVIWGKRFRKPVPIENPLKHSNSLHEMLLDAEVASSKGDVELFYNIIFEIMRDCVGKYYSSPRCETSGSDSPGYDEIQEITAITAACDKVRYGRIMPNSSAMTADLERLKQLLSNPL